MKTYWFNGVEYVVTEEEFDGLLNGWLNAVDMFG